MMGSSHEHEKWGNLRFLYEGGQKHETKSTETSRSMNGPCEGDQASNYLEANKKIT